MAEGRVAATRSNLIRSRRRLDRVRKGIELLTRKRRALVADLFRLAPPAIEARGRAQAAVAAATRALHRAAAVHGAAALEVMGWPLRPVEVEVSVGESWGVTSTAVRRLTPVRRTLAGRGQAPGPTGPAGADAGRAFEELLELLVDTATTELTLRRLAEALARTSRQVSTLERRVSPRLGDDIRRIREVLEEREREDHTRLGRLQARRRAGRTRLARRAPGSGHCN